MSFDPAFPPPAYDPEVRNMDRAFFRRQSKPRSLADIVAESNREIARLQRLRRWTHYADTIAASQVRP